MVRPILSRVQAYTDHRQVEPEGLAQLLMLWRSAAATGAHGVPTLDSLDVSALGEVLNNMALIELEAGPDREPFYRLVGANLKTLLGADPTRRYLKDAYGPQIYAEIVAAFQDVVSTRRRSFYKREFKILFQTFGYNRLLAPLVDARGRVRWMIVGLYPARGLQHAVQWRTALAALKQREYAEAMSLKWRGAVEDADLVEAGAAPATGG